MVKYSEHTFKGINVDLNPRVYGSNFYYNARNISITANSNNGEFASISNDKGNSLYVSFPTVTISNGIVTWNAGRSGVVSVSSTNATLNEQIMGTSHKYIGSTKILGTYGTKTHSTTETSLLIFTKSGDYSIIWSLTVNDLVYDIHIKYLSTTLGFDENYPIEAISNIESETIAKVYWIDSKHLFRYANLLDPNLLNTPSYMLEALPEALWYSPTPLEFVNGGTYKAGIIQYAVAFYSKFGSQSRLSPLSRQLYLVNEDGGLAPDSISSRAVKLRIDIPTEFKKYYGMLIYAVHRTSLEALPTISLVGDQKINNNDYIEYIDAGSNVIKYISAEEYMYLGGEYIVPKSFEQGDNYLFFANYYTKSLVLPTSVDFRAFAHNRNQEAVLINIGEPASAAITTGPAVSWSNIPYDHDAHNIEAYDTTNLIYADPRTRLYKFQGDGMTLGGEGRNIKYEIGFTNIIGIDPYTIDIHNESNQDPSILNTYNNITLKSGVLAADATTLKRGETYRVGIQVRDIYGRESNVAWVNDIKIPEINDYDEDIVATGQTSEEIIPQYVKLTFTIKNMSSLKAALEASIGVEITRFRIMYVERTPGHKSILTQGIFNSTLMTDIVPGINFMSDIITRVRSTYTNIFSFQSFGSGQTFLAGRPKSISPNLLGSTIIGATGNSYSEFPQGDTNYTLGIHSDMIEIYSPELLEGLIVPKDSTVSPVSTIQCEKTYTNYTNYSSEVAHIFTNKNKLYRNSKQPLKINFTSTYYKGSYISCKRLLWYDIDNTSDINYPWNSMVELQGQEYRPNAYFLSNHKYFNKRYNWTNNQDIPLEDLFTTDEEVTTTGVFTYYNGTDINYIAEETPNMDSDTSLLVSINNRAARRLVCLLNKLPNSFNRYRIVSPVASPNEMDLTLGDEANILNSPFSGEDLPDYSNIFEIRRVLVGQYGGHTYEAKSRNEYIPMSSADYTSSSKTISVIKANLGDTYIQRFYLLRHWYEGEADPSRVTFNNEVISYITETSINLDLRHDLIAKRQNHYNKTQEDSYLLNNVYNQKDNFVKGWALDHINSDPQDMFYYSIVPTFRKNGGELIDAWTDIQLLERHDLESTYGPITSIKRFGGNMIGFQPRAISNVIINPRVALSTSDGAPVELGTGVNSNQPIIPAHRYISEMYGSVNKFSIKAGVNGLYFLDAFNSALMVLSNNIQELNVNTGTVSLFKSLVDYRNIIKDNPLIKTGVSASYINHNYFLTLFKGDNTSETIVYNDITSSVVTLSDNKPTAYIDLGVRQFTINPSSPYQLYESWTGAYGTYYGTTYPSSITIIESSDYNVDKRFTNIKCVGETYNSSGVIVPNKTFEKVKVWNEMFTSPEAPLVISANLNKKFGFWDINLPKALNSNGSMVGGSHAFIKLSVTNTTNYRYTITSLSVAYVV